MYYADVGSEEQKAEIQQQWENGTQRVIVCSSAFGLGINQPDVRFVGHVGPIYDIESYGQESGRAGRDGQPSEAIMILGPGRQRALQQQYERRRRAPTRSPAIITDQDRMRVKLAKAEQFVSGISCRRVWLDQELDGRTNRIRCEEGEQRCNVCIEDDRIMTESDALREAYIAQQENKAHRRGVETCDSGVGLMSSISTSNLPSSPPVCPLPLPISTSASRVSNDLSIPFPTIRSEPTNRHTSSPPISSKAHKGQIQTIISTSDPACGSPSSVESFDRGFTTDVAPIDRFVFQHQQEQQQSGRAYTQSQNISQSREVYDLERELEWWVEQCPLCVILGLQERHTQHTLRECNHPEADGAREAWFEMSTSMKPAKPGQPGKFAPYSCCFECFVPQSICQKWQPQESGRGRWKGTGQACQFRDIIMPVVVCMFREGSSEVYEKYNQWMTECRISSNNAEDVLRWFGQKVVWGGIEGSKLCQVFWEFAKIFHYKRDI